ncbi:MAG TPA: hypothetical protein VD866_12715 [Urbifossiella sp.]|nr:hypothetical protein [Urbifossiella sp.]
MAQRRFGFPLLMLLGFVVGAGVAVGVAYALAAQRKTFQYTTLLQLVASLGATGTYLGHVVGALRDKDSGLAPFGQLPTGVMLTGLTVWFVGTVAVCGTVLAVMTSIHGPTPH